MRDAIIRLVAAISGVSPEDWREEISKRLDAGESVEATANEIRLLHLTRQTGQAEKEKED